MAVAEASQQLTVVTDLSRDTAAAPSMNVRRRANPRFDRESARALRNPIVAVLPAHARLRFAAQLRVRNVGEPPRIERACAHEALDRAGFERIDLCKAEPEVDLGPPIDHERALIRRDRRAMVAREIGSRADRRRQQRIGRRDAITPFDVGENAFPRSLRLIVGAVAAILENRGAERCSPHTTERTNHELANGVAAAEKKKEQAGDPRGERSTTHELRHPTQSAAA